MRCHVSSVGQNNVIHGVQAGGQHCGSSNQVTARQGLLRWYPFVGYDAHEGWHEYGHEALGGEKQPDLRAEPCFSEETAHGSEVSAPHCELEEVHDYQPQADQFILHIWFLNKFKLNKFKYFYAKNAYL